MNVMFRPGSRVFVSDAPKNRPELAGLVGSVMEAANSTVIYDGALYLTQFDDGSRFVMRDTELSEVPTTGEADPYIGGYFIATDSEGALVLWRERFPEDNAPVFVLAASSLPSDVWTALLTGLGVI